MSRPNQTTRETKHQPMWDAPGNGFFLDKLTCSTTLNIQDLVDLPAAPSGVEVINIARLMPRSDELVVTAVRLPDGRVFRGRAATVTFGPGGSHV